MLCLLALRHRLRTGGRAKCCISAEYCTSPARTDPSCRTGSASSPPASSPPRGGYRPPPPTPPGSPGVRQPPPPRGAYPPPPPPPPPLVGGGEGGGGGRPLGPGSLFPTAPRRARS